MNNYIKKTLKNGVKLYLYVDKRMKKTYVDYLINYGSSGKWFDFYYNNKLYHVLPGCAHFLEHMLGEHSSFGNAFKYFKNKKYWCNAMTSDTRTVFFIYGKDDIKDSISKLINMVDNQVFTEEDVRETSHAIEEETKLHISDARYISYKLAQRNLFKKMDLVHESLTAIGNENTTKKLDYNILKLCYEAFYYDSNKELTIGGNFDPDEMTKYIESIYANINPHLCNVKSYDYDISEIKRAEEIKYLSTNDDIISICLKENYTNFIPIEIYYYGNIFLKFKLSSEMIFIHQLKEKDIINRICDTDINLSLKKCYYIVIISEVKNKEKYITELMNELSKIDFDESEFELYKKEYISQEVKKYDNVVMSLRNNSSRRIINDDFTDVEFIKSMTYNRFIEYVKSLKLNEFSIAIVRDADKNVKE
jgi:hypothetical protein